LQTSRRIRRIGSYPLSVIASSYSPGGDMPVAGTAAVLTVELALNSGPWIGSSPLFVGEPPL
jgi:hypothetical protein